MMIRKAIFFVFLFSVFWLLAQAISGKIIAAHDGDTITIRSDAGVNYKIRLNGVDCPEKSQDFGKKAKDFTWNFCYGKTITAKLISKDKYDRNIAEVFANGQSLNSALVAAGLAWHYKKYSSDEGLARLEQDARAARRGLWSIPNPMAPWDFRHKGKSQPVGNLNGDEVMVCNSQGAKTYHKKMCTGLSRCNKGISKLSKSSAESQGRKACGYCY
jgi:micrococcal nuclease